MLRCRTLGYPWCTSAVPSWSCRDPLPQVDIAGRYLLRVALCRPGGLTGRYFSDSFFDVEEFQRVDRWEVLFILRRKGRRSRL